MSDTRRPAVPDPPGPVEFSDEWYERLLAAGRTAVPASPWARLRRTLSWSTGTSRNGDWRPHTAPAWVHRASSGPASWVVASVVVVVAVVVVGVVGSGPAARDVPASADATVSRGTASRGTGPAGPDPVTGVTAIPPGAGTSPPGGPQRVDDADHASSPAPRDPAAATTSTRRGEAASGASVAPRSGQRSGDRPPGGWIAVVETLEASTTTRRQAVARAGVLTVLGVAVDVIGPGEAGGEPSSWVLATGPFPRRAQARVSCTDRTAAPGCVVRPVEAGPSG